MSSIFYYAIGTDARNGDQRWELFEYIRKKLMTVHVTVSFKK